VRRTNPSSLQYIGVDGYAPKPIDCKPKTAQYNVGSWRTAGLVVSPHVHPAAFESAKLQRARLAWNSFALGKDLERSNSSNGYTLDTNRQSRHYGALRLEGKYLFGDYDLYDIILADHPSANLAAIETLRGQPHRRGPRAVPIMKFVNSLIGAEMIQHGAEFQYADHSEQSIDVFGPEGEQFTILNEYSLRKWYEDVWQRKSIAL
jgi:hypothetical protein